MGVWENLSRISGLCTCYCQENDLALLKFVFLLTVIFLIFSIGNILAQETAASFAPVERVEFAGNTVLSADTLSKAANVPTGTTLTPALLTDAVRRIETAYLQAGYIGTVTFYEFRDTPAPRTLVFNIAETKVSEVRIVGLKQTREETIRQLIDTEAGQVYNTRTVQNDVTRLYQTAIFDHVQVHLLQGAKNDQTIVEFTFKEAKSRRIDLGGSYSPEGRLIMQLQYTEANLFGRAQQLSVAANIGSIAAKLGGQIAYFNPIFGSRGTTLSARGYSDIYFRFSQDLVTNPSEGRYFERRTGFQSTLSRPSGNFSRYAYGFRYENVTVSNLPVDFLSAPISPNAAVIAPSLKYQQDRRLTLVIPASGSYLSGFIEPGFVNFHTGGSKTIGHVQGEWRQYFPLRPITKEEIASENPKPVRNLAVRLSAGTTTGEIPFFEQYFVGGILDLRGYRESRFWGKNFFTLNTELRMPISQKFIGLAFVDVGDAWGSDFQFAGTTVTPFEQHRDFSPRVGAGVGIWYVSDIGILRLEFARGEANRIHFAVGESF